MVQEDVNLVYEDIKLGATGHEIGFGWVIRWIQVGLDPVVLV